jgi:peptidylprolyl isomerase
VLRRPRPLTARLLPALAAGAILLAACGSDDGAADTTTPTLPLDPISSTTTLPANPDKPTVSSLPTVPLTDLVITDLTDGTGPEAKAGDTVIVDYVGVRSADGTEFDNSYDRGQAFPVSPLGTASVIDGWNEGLIGAKAGGRRQLDIPAAKAYGDNPPGAPIQAGDDLTFVIDVRAVVPAADPAAEPQVTVQPTTGTTETTHTDLVEGTGAEAAKGSTAILQYIAFSGADGTKLESSWVAGGQPMTVTVGDGQYLPGIDKGVEGMKVGGRRQVTIPAADAFGPDGNEQLGLPAGADLVMVFDLVAVY